MVNSWMNSDGLYLKFGTDKAAVETAGEYRRTGGKLTEVEVKLTLTSLGTAAAIQSDQVFIPAGVRIQEIEITNLTAATSGGSAVLNIGLQRVDRTTELDYDGFIAAQAITSHDAAGETTVVRVGSTAAGALLGTTLANTGYITADYDTAAYTAGVLLVTIRYFTP